MNGLDVLTDRVVCGNYCPIWIPLEGLLILISFGVRMDYVIDEKGDSRACFIRVFLARLMDFWMV